MSAILRWLADLVRYFVRTLDWPLLLALSTRSTSWPAQRVR